MASAKPSLLFLTNLYNDAKEEDLYLTQRLRESFNIFISHPLDCESLEDRYDAVLIRNIWPSHAYEDQKTGLIRRLIRKGLMPMSEAERGYLEQEHYLEKEYLLDLYTKDYPVIPTVDNLMTIDKLGQCPVYFIKPKNQCDGEGSEKLTREILLQRNPKEYLIQPYVQFDYEICFYFIDNEFVYAFSTPNRLAGEKCDVYTPTDSDMEFARKFVDWNKLSFGLQRVDAVRVTETQKLLLTELEDFGPYLFLLELPELIRDKVVKALTHSLCKRIEG